MAKETPPIKEFHLELAELTFTGRDLVRPESVLTQPDGTIWTSDGRGGVMRIRLDGTQEFIGGLGGEPNGIALCDDGSLFIANMQTGSIQRLYPDRHIEDVLTSVDGMPLTCANYVFRDSRGRLWLSFSTRESSWWTAALAPRPDGYIVLLDEKGAHVVADGIFFTNEIRLDAREEYLYVAESMMSRMLRFRVQSDGSLIDKEVVGPSNLGFGAFVDGFAFDSEGNIWITTVVRNGVGIISSDGDYHVVFEDVNEQILHELERKQLEGAVAITDMLAAAGHTLKLITSIAFGGPDLCTVYIGSQGMSTLPTFRSPVAGLPMSHWR